MARQVRIQFEGAIYHVMSRGNNGNGIFFGKKGCEKFVDTLDEACQRTGWIIHAYVLMGNHYHLLMETPEANLVDGMKWLQGTYTQRVNAWRGRRGHLFQGRYRAQLVNGADGDGTYFKMVSNYIHLNPSRAHMVGSGTRWEKLTDYPWSSLPLYSKWKSKRPLWLEVGDVFDSHRLEDNARGREAYADYMNKRSVEVQTDEDSGSYGALRRGWCVGDSTFRQKMLDKVEAFSGRKRESLSGAAVKEHREHEAGKLIEEGLRKLGVAEEALENMAHSAVEKKAIAAWVSSQTLASTEWLAKALRMGHRSSVSQAKKWAKENKNGQKWLKKLM